jgi:hypothetical protein
MRDFLVKKATIALMSMIPTMCFPVVERYSPPMDALWPLVAKSHVILTGTLTVPVELITSCLASNQHDYVELHVETQQIYKGNISGNNIGIRWYTKADGFSPSPEFIIASNNKTVLLFLEDAKMLLYGSESEEVLGFEPKEPKLDDYFYFAGSTSNAMSLASADKVGRVKQEIEKQKQILARFNDMFSPSDENLYEKVKSHIDNSTRDAESQKTAFRDLESLGMEAVAPIIMLMDDRRNLAIPQMSLKNRFGHWEACRHYTPKKVVDGMNAILNQITGLSFGEIHNGGTELQRQETVNGWKIYLYHWKKSSNK